MKDSSRVVRLEWRKARRQQHKGLTSHSWLEAYLLDDRRLRLEFFADTGLTESMFAAGRGERESVVYEDRIAGPHDFVRPLTAQRLRRVAEGAAARPYSLTDWNCHHFVLDIWNNVVISMLQRTHYPDRVKTGVLWGASESLGKLWSEGASWAAQIGIVQTPPSTTTGKQRETAAAAPNPLGRFFLGSYSSSPIACQELPLESGTSTPSRCSLQSTPTSLPRGDVTDVECNSHAQIEARQEEGNRVSGEVSVPPSPGCAAERGWQLARALDEGAVCLLQPGRGLATADLPPQAPRSARAWAEAWLPGAGEPGVRLADRLGSTDAVDLVMRVLVPGSDGMAGRRRAAETSFASLSSESLASAAGEHGTVTSTCFVALIGSEVRLAIYAVLGPVRIQGPQRRLRLLSGNLHEGKDGTFAYTLADIKQEDVEVTAKTCVQEELPALQFALNTGDWGFVTLL